ncbi:MAG: FMN-binding protein [Bacteroidaceae bacterium]|nr:FMN-binding protein [Bacteroidaceae bacterium]
MKQLILGLLLLAASTAQAQQAISQRGDTTVINTTSLTQNVRGYRGPTPLNIFVHKNKIVRIEALRNRETPKYFQMVRQQLLGAWDGMTVKKALKAEVDGVTGATLSSNAVKANVKAGLQQLKKK